MGTNTKQTNMKTGAAPRSQEGPTIQQYNKGRRKVNKHKQHHQQTKSKEVQKEGSASAYKLPPPAWPAGPPAQQDLPSLDMVLRGAQDQVRMLGLEGHIIFDDVLLEGPDLARTRVHELLRGDLIAGDIAAGAVLCLLLFFRGFWVVCVLDC